MAKNVYLQLQTTRLPKTGPREALKRSNQGPLRDSGMRVTRLRMVRFPTTLSLWSRGQGPYRDMDSVQITDKAMVSIEEFITQEGIQVHWQYSLIFLSRASRICVIGDAVEPVYL